MIRAVPPILAPFLKREEGVRTTPYKDSAGRWTCGVGHCDPSMDPTKIWTQSMVDAALDLDMATAASRLAGAAPITQDPNKINDNQYAALTSFVFNAGAGHWSIWPRLEAGEVGQIPALLGEFIYAGRPPKKVQGLINRRAAEIVLWNGADLLCKEYTALPAQAKD